MAEIDQRSGSERRDADGRSGIHTGFSLGRTALTGWALTAVLGLAGFGTALGATPLQTPVRVADTTTFGGIGTVVRGSAPAVAPRTVLRVGQVITPFAVAADTAPLGAALPLGTGPMGTVTAASVPTPAAALPTGTVAAPGAGTPDLAFGGSAPTTAATAPAGPAAQLRQAAFTAAAPDQRATLAIRTALAQIGLPYVWGGDGPTNGDAGFDCSGLTTFSYGTAGVLLPRTAHTQYNNGPHVPDGAALQPGDLVFYGTTARVHHVGMYLGAGRMVNAPTFGKPVQVAFYRYRGDDYLGATRPAAAGGSLTTGVLPYVDPLPAVPDVDLAPVQQQQQAQDRVFQAPTASLPAVLPQPGDAALPSEQQSAAQSIAESDVVTGGRVAPRPAAAPAVVSPPAGGAPAGGAPAGGPPSGGSSSGNGSTPVAGATTSSSAPATTPPVTTPPVPAPVSSTAPAGATSSASTTTSAPVTSSPAGTATSATSTTSVPAAPTSDPATAPSSAAPAVPTSTTTTTTTAATPAPVTQPPTTSSSAPVVVEKASGSTTATTTLAPTSIVRATTAKATTSKVATPAAPKTTTTPSKTKTVTSPTTTAKAVTTTSKPAAKTEDDDPTTTKTSASKTSASKTSKTKTSEEKADDETSEKKTTEKKTSSEKTSSEKTSSEKTSSEKTSSEKSSSSDEDS